MSVLMGKVKKNVLVYSFEANKFVFDLLKMNLEINDIEHKCFNVAVTDNIEKNYHFKNTTQNKFKTLGSFNLSEIKETNIKKNQITSFKIDSISFEKKNFIYES